MVSGDFLHVTTKRGGGWGQSEFRSVPYDVIDSFWAVFSTTGDRRLSGPRVLVGHCLHPTAAGNVTEQTDGV